MENKTKISTWNEVGELFICDNCNYYTDQMEDECPMCKCKMLGIQKEIKDFKFI